MSTTTYTAQTSNKTTTVAKHANNNGWYAKFIEKAEFSYFGIIAMTISIGSILGGIAAMFVFQNDAPTWQLGVAMMVSMANNVAAIGQAPTKWVVNTFVLCVVLNLLIIAINL